jgi:hypothetical protein
MVTQAKTNATAYMNLRHIGYADEQIPAYFKRPTPEEQAAFNEAIASGKQPYLP